MIDNSIKSIAIGSFDGMHIAHKELISLAEAVAVIEHERAMLTPGYKRSWYCNKPLAFYHLSKIRSLTAKEFLEILKNSYPKLEKIVVGYDFRFGVNRAGSPKLIEENFSGEVIVINEVSIQGISIHAKTIRDFLKKGDIRVANAMLGRNYRVDGIVVRGQGIGSKELVPTINLEVRGYQLPQDGVYSGFTQIEDRRYKSVIFIGNRVSTNGGFAIESHILEEFEVEPKGRVFLEFQDFLRPNRRFNSLSELKKQIENDIDIALSSL